MSMDLDGMMRCRVDKLVFSVGRDRDSAVRVARKLPAIDIFAGHVPSPDEARSHYSLFTLGPTTRADKRCMKGRCKQLKRLTEASSRKSPNDSSVQEM